MVKLVRIPPPPPHVGRYALCRSLSAINPRKLAHFMHFQGCDAAKYAVKTAEIRQKRTTACRRGSHRPLSDVPMSGLSWPHKSMVGRNRRQRNYRRSRSRLPLRPVIGNTDILVGQVPRLYRRIRPQECRRYAPSEISFLQTASAKWPPSAVHASRALRRIVISRRWSRGWSCPRSRKRL